MGTMRVAGQWALACWRFSFVGMNCLGADNGFGVGWLRLAWQRWQPRMPVLLLKVAMIEVGGRGAN
jgi:uncharacterized SAM-binding protein YcdF (DUF218 family)